MNKKPTVMISSTFYDLRQVRADLAPFFSEDLGFDVLLSETPSFPVEPDVETVQNCTRRVEQHVDILVLLIGGRYGFVDRATSRSVTNLEYLTARAKRIPVYAFVEKRVLAVLPVYKENMGGQFTSVVDDIRVFDFIVQVREEHRNWCFEFEVSQDIIQALRQQLAFLTYRGLVAQHQLSIHPHLRELKLLSGEALRHALERRPLWEHRTFASALITEVDNRKELRRRHELGIAFGEFRHIQANQVQSWFSERMGELMSLITMAETLFNRDFCEALGPEGDHGDPELVAFAARSIGRLYEEAIEWALRWRRTSCDEKWKNLANLMAHLVDDIIQQIEEVGPSIQATITEMDEAMAKGEDPNRRIVLTLELPRAAEVQEELRRLAPTR